MSERVPAAPRGSGAAGRRLWSSVLQLWELDEHELLLLRELVRTTDLLDELQAVVDRDGLMVDSPSGPKVHPAIVEARQARIAAARLTAVLRLPSGSEGDEVQGRRQQRRVGVRGAYGVKKLQSVPS